MAICQMHVHKIHKRHFCIRLVLYFILIHTFTYIKVFVTGTAYLRGSFHLQLLHTLNVDIHVLKPNTMFFPKACILIKNWFNRSLFYCLK